MDLADGVHQTLARGDAAEDDAHVRTRGRAEDRPQGLGPQGAGDEDGVDDARRRVRRRSAPETAVGRGVLHPGQGLPPQGLARGGCAGVRAWSNHAGRGAASAAAPMACAWSRRARNPWGSDSAHASHG